MIETLQKKLEQLLKERENAQVAVLNYNGAVAILQQLIQEEQAKQTAEQEVVTKAQLPKATKGAKVITLDSPTPSSN